MFSNAYHIYESFSSGSLGSLNPYHTGDAESIDTWNGSKNVIRGEMIEKNSFLRMLESSEDSFGWDSFQQAYDEDDTDFDNMEIEDGPNQLQDWYCRYIITCLSYPLTGSDVNAWSDFLKTPLHPPSVKELPFWPISEPFDTYSAGELAK